MIRLTVDSLFKSSKLCHDLLFNVIHHEDFVKLFPDLFNSRANNIVCCNRQDIFLRVFAKRIIFCMLPTTYHELPNKKHAI